MDPTCTEIVTLGASRISDMGNAVAGFAISSYLVLVFATLKDLSPWVKAKSGYFAAGILLGACMYVGAIWLLHAEEMSLIIASSPGDQAVMKQVGHVVVLARTAGVAAFACVALLAIWGSRHGLAHSAGPPGKIVT